MREKCFVAQGAYSNPIEVIKTEGLCFECKCLTPVLEFDSSDGEYTAMRFCLGCLKDFSEGKISASTRHDNLSGY